GLRRRADVPGRRGLGTPFARGGAKAVRVTDADVRAVFAEPEHGPLLVELFRRAEVPCHCRYWHFPEGTNAWLAGCAPAPERNRDEMLQALAMRSPEMSGVVALTGDLAVGWLKLAPAVTLPKLYAQRLYRGLPCFDGPREGVFTIGCMLVDP